jgi:MoxR-like ATPase
VIAMAKAVARLGGRDYVVPQDIRQVLLPTVSHRLPVTHAARSQNMTADTVLQQILDRIPAPKLR